MKKRVIVASLLLIMLTNFVSALNGYYGFSLSDFLASINPSSMILVILFIIFFAVLHTLVFMNLFRKNRGISAIVSFCVSLLMIYGINTMRWDVEGFFYGVGLSSEILSIVIPVILIATIALLIVKFKFHGFLMVLGSLFLLGGLLGIVFESFISIILGAVLFVFGLILWKRHKRGSYYGGGGYGGRAWGAAKSVGRGARAVGRGAWGASKGVGRGARRARDWQRERPYRKTQDFERRADRRETKRELNELRRQRGGEVGRKLGTAYGKVRYGKQAKAAKKAQSAAEDAERKKIEAEIKTLNKEIGNWSTVSMDPRISPPKQRQALKHIEIRNQRIQDLQQRLSQL